MTPQQIRHLRTSINLTRAEYAEMFCVSVRTIEAYENGARKPSKLVLREMRELKKLINANGE